MQCRKLSSMLIENKAVYIRVLSVLVRSCFDFIMNNKLDLENSLSHDHFLGKRHYAQTDLI